MRPRLLTTLPQISQHPLEQPGDRSWFSVIMPLARVNVLTFDTSLELTDASYSAQGSSSIARTTAEQYHGNYSLAITPTAATTDGARTATFNLTAGTTYAVSCKVKGRAGVLYRFYIGDAGGTEEAGAHFRASGRWQWVSAVWKAEAITTRLFLRKDGSADTGVFYWDGLQVESCADGVLAPTTYISGDEVGLVPNEYPPAYGWNGTPYASSSYRTGQTRAGGYAVPLSRYGFVLVALIGLGGIPGQHVATPYAQLDGAQYERTVKGPRDLTLVGRLQARTPAQLDRYRAQLSAALDRDATGQQQPLVLYYQRYDGERVQSDAGRLVALYSGGLEGNADNLFSEQVPISFTAYVPFVLADRESGASLTVQQSVSNANYILYRSPGGVWQALGTGMNASVFTFARGRNGQIFAGGAFTSAGTSGADYIARYDPTSALWTNLTSDTALNGVVRAIAVGPDGRIYVGGEFINASGIANADYIAVWDPNTATWAALGTGANGNVWSLAFDGAGNLYAGGEFTLMGGVANTVRIAKWNGAAWSALGTGAASGNVTALAVGLNGTTVYAGGSFANMGGVAAADALAEWNGSSWSGLSTGANAAVNTLALGPDGQLYVGGAFTTLGGVSAPNLGRWNGVGFEDLGSILDGSVDSMAFDRSGALHLLGTFTSANGVTLPDNFARMTGRIVVAQDVDLPSATPFGLLPEPAGGLYVAFSSSGTAIAAGLTTVTNEGTAKTYPTLIIKGPSSGSSRIYQIANTTTNRAIYLNYTIQSGETARLSFEPDNLSFESNFQGNIARTILPGSNEADFFLQPGENAISLFAASSTVTATMTWRPRYGRVDDLML